MRKQPELNEEQKDALKRIIEQKLLLGSVDNVHNFFNDLMAQCRTQSIVFNGAVAIEHWWNLARLGVVAIPGGNISVTYGNLGNQIVLTEGGRKLLERGEQSPHDPPKYLSAVRCRVESPDEIAMTYLDEAVGAWAAGLYRASAVMLGCACERLVIVLAEEVAKAGIEPWANKIKKKMQSEPSGISRLFDDVRDSLASLAGDKKLSGELADALDRKLSAIFDHARGLRNKSGHPTGTTISADDAEAGLLMFPGFYAFVNDLCKNLAKIRSEQVTKT